MPDYYHSTFSTRGEFRLRLGISRGTQNKANNTTRVMWYLDIIKDSYSPSWSNNYSSWSTSGINTRSGSFTFDFRNTDALRLASGSADVKHDSNGNKTLNMKAACNAAVLGSTSMSFNYALPRILPKPGAPGKPSLSYTAPKTVKISWGAASGSSISGYQVQAATKSNFSGAATANTGTSRSYTKTNHSLGTTYYYRVRAQNSTGWGPWSATASYKIPDVPGSPTGMSVTPLSEAKLRVSWSAPSNDGGLSVTGYDVQYSTSSSFSGAVTASASSSPYTTPGLKPGVPYWVRVRAKNAAGASGWTAAVSVLTLSGGEVFVTDEWVPAVAEIYDGGWHAAVGEVFVDGEWVPLK